MFKIKDGYFSHIECPNLKNYDTCDIINCIYKHQVGLLAKRSVEEDETSLPAPKRADSVKRNVPVKAPIAAGGKVDNIDNNDSNVPNKSEDKENEKDTPIILPTLITHIKLLRTDRMMNIKQIRKQMTGKTPNKDATTKEFELSKQADSPQKYEELIRRFLNKEELKDPEFILPTHIAVPPATIQVRKQNILELVKVIQQNQPFLTTPKLKAIEEEFKIANSTSKHTYQQNIRKKVYELKNPAKFQNQKKELTDDDLYEQLHRLIIPQDTLEKFGYITKIPEPIEPNEVRKCRRCGHDFKMKDHLLPIHCAFHPGKVTVRNDKTRAYSCCGAEIGHNETEACTSYMYHVFYWDNPGEMHRFLPFKRTSDIYKINPNAFKALGIDCEMGFTTKGFELLRVTAMDFFTGEEVLDVLVKPIGEVVDLNSRWSGISEIKPDALTFDELIALLGEIMDPNTILIGHGLENDLNSMRLIHSKVVDTAILYPKFKTSPRYRYPLKFLTFKYLGKTIQTGEHDSGEDALAAIDIVKYFIQQDSN